MNNNTKENSIPSLEVEKLEYKLVNSKFWKPKGEYLKIHY